MGSTDECLSNRPKMGEFLNEKNFFSYSDCGSNDDSGIRKPE
jgi:hypothetical protein